MSHRQGSSPVWERRCTTRLSDRLNRFPHRSHWCLPFPAIPRAVCTHLAAPLNTAAVRSFCNSWLGPHTCDTASDSLSFEAPTLAPVFAAVAARDVVESETKSETGFAQDGIPGEFPTESASVIVEDGGASELTWSTCTWSALNSRSHIMQRT